MMKLCRAVPRMIASTLILLLVVTAPVGFAQAGSRGGGGGRTGGVGGGAAIGGGRGSGPVGGGVRGGVPGGGGRDYPSHGRTYGDHSHRDHGDRFFFGFSGVYAPAWWGYDPYYYWGASPYYYPYYSYYPYYPYYGYPYPGPYYYGYPYYYGSDPCASQDPAYAPYCPPPTDYPYDPGYSVPPVTYPLPAPPGGESQPSTSPEQPTSPTSNQTP